MNQIENDDTISTASSDLSFSVCELILGPGACQCQQKKQPTLSEKTIFYSFSSPDKDIAVRESGDLVKVEFTNKNNSTENVAGKLSKQSVKNEEITESTIASVEYVEISPKDVESLKKQKSSKNNVTEKAGIINEEAEVEHVSSEKLSKSRIQEEQILSKKPSRMSNKGEQSHRSVYDEAEAEKPRKNLDSHENRRFAETQTVAVQTQTKTTDSESDCKCEIFQQKCPCPDCNPPKCLYSSSKEEAPTRDYDESSSSSVYNGPSTPSPASTHRAHYCNCRASPWKCDCEDFSDNSDDSYTTDFLNLPYQNNEEYLDLLRELERKLLARNRERVRRTRLEFEQRSRQNQNLDKQPVYDYGGDESCSFFKRKLKKCRAAPCAKCKKRVNSDILQNEKKWEKFNFVDSFTKQVANEKNDKYSHIERSLNKSHWQLDPRSGEWVKVASFEQTQFANPLHGDSGDFDGQNRGRSVKRAECPCCCKKKYKNY